jgi:hypothetical protein
VAAVPEGFARSERTFSTPFPKGSIREAISLSDPEKFGRRAPSARKDKFIDSMAWAKGRLAFPRMAILPGAGVMTSWIITGCSNSSIPTVVEVNFPVRTWTRQKWPAGGDSDKHRRNAGFAQQQARDG